MKGRTLEKLKIGLQLHYQLAAQAQSLKNPTQPYSASVLLDVALQNESLLPSLLLSVSTFSFKTMKKSFVVAMQHKL